MEVFANEDILIKIELTNFAQDAAIKHFAKNDIANEFTKEGNGIKILPKILQNKILLIENFDRNIFFNKKFGLNNFFRKTRLQNFDRNFFGNTFERTIFRKTFHRNIFCNISIAKSFAKIPIAISSFTKILIAISFANDSNRKKNTKAEKNKNRNKNKKNKKLGTRRRIGPKRRERIRRTTKNL